MKTFMVIKILNCFLRLSGLLNLTLLIRFRKTIPKSVPACFDLQKHKKEINNKRYGKAIKKD